MGLNSFYCMIGEKVETLVVEKSINCHWLFKHSNYSINCYYQLDTVTTVAVNEISNAYSYTRLGWWLQPYREQNLMSDDKLCPTWMIGNIGTFRWKHPYWKILSSSVKVKHYHWDHIAQSRLLLHRWCICNIM